jgi:hypothetical protein
MFRTVKSTCVVALLAFIAFNASGEEFLGGSFVGTRHYSPTNMTFYVNPNSGFIAGHNPISFATLVSVRKPPVRLGAICHHTLALLFPSMIPIQQKLRLTGKISFISDILTLMEGG